MADEYFKVQTEMAYIKRNIEKLSDRLSTTTETQQNDIQNLEMEKVSNSTYVIFYCSEILSICQWEDVKNNFEDY